MTIRRLITRTTVNAGLMAGVLAFLVQIMAWSVTMPAMAQPTTAGMAQPATAEMVITICTADGLKDITFAAPDRETADQRAEKPTAKITKAGHCPLCPVMSGAGLPPVDLTAQPLRLPMLADARTLPGDVIAAGWFLSSLQATGPPARG